MERAIKWTSFVVTLTLHLNSAQYFLDKTTALKDTSLYDGSFQALLFEHHTVDTCFSQCLMDCFCVAFQVHGTHCLLLPLNRHMVPSSLSTEVGTTYYEISLESGAENYCSRASCCNTSHPCHGGEVCKPIFTKDVAPRHTCYCPRVGYTGINCDIPATSCKNYLGHHDTPGEYVIHDANMTPYNVTCDFSSGFAWTLIQSYQLQENDKFRYSPLTIDNPLSEDTPNWSAYRLSKARMALIQEDSMLFRITCNYDTEGLVYTDYIEVDVADLDILTFNSSGCVPVKSIDIRGNVCETDPCTVRFYQPGNDTLHIDTHDCTFIRPQGSMPCATVTGEDNFGFYQCQNPSHRCSASPTSTTQIWFGGSPGADI